MIPSFLLLTFLSTNFVVNGDFETDYRTGWYEDFSSEPRKYWYRRTPYIDSLKPGYEMKVNKTWQTTPSYCDLIQDVDIDNLALECEALLWVRADITFENGGWCFASFDWVYLDALGDELGKTRIYARTGNVPTEEYANTSTQHCTEAEDDWEIYSFDVRDEMARMPGIDTSRVAKIRLIFHTEISASHRSGC